MTAPIRVAARQRLLDLYRNRLDGVQVEYNEPQSIEQQSVWLGSVSGAQRVRTMKTGRKTREDEFTIEVFCFAATPGEGDGTESDLAVWALFEQVEDVHATLPFLSIDGNGLPGLNHAYVQAVEGPNPGQYIVGEQAVGYGSQVRAEIFFSTNLT